MGEYLLEWGQFISGYTTEENGIPSSNICWLPLVCHRGVEPHRSFTHSWWNVKGLHPVQTAAAVAISWVQQLHHTWMSFCCPSSSSHSFHPLFCSAPPVLLTELSCPIEGFVRQGLAMYMAQAVWKLMIFSASAFWVLGSQACTAVPSYMDFFHHKKMRDLLCKLSFSFQNINSWSLFKGK